MERNTEDDSTQCVKEECKAEVPCGVVRETVTKHLHMGTGKYETHVYPVDHSVAEIRGLILEAHPPRSQDVGFSPHSKSREYLLFEKVVTSIQGEREELEAEEQRLIARLDEVQAKLTDVYSTEGTLTWLQEHVFDLDNRVDTIRSILPGVSDAYSKMMLRYKKYRESASLVNQPDGSNPVAGPPRLPNVGRGFNFKCKVCGMEFQHEGDLEKHIQSNCEYKDNDAFQAAYHMKCALRMITCTKCGFVAKNPSGLKTHMRSCSSCSSAKKGKK